MQDTNLFEKALILKGYGSNKAYSYSNKERLESIRKVDGNLIVKPYVIKDLIDYMFFISQQDFEKNRPLVYRGQGNANFALNPKCLRVDPKLESEGYESFYRKFSNEFDGCRTNFEKLILMQHFELGSRALDITENPLIALYFACSPMKKFNQNRNKEFAEWGEVVLFREPEENKNNTKPIYSSSVSVISSTAFVEREFSLWHLGAQWKRDNNFMRTEQYIPLGEVIRKSILVRAPQNNPRIKNQQGAFILVNANEVKSIFGTEDNADELTEYIMNNSDVTYNYLCDNYPWKKELNKEKPWELKFEKVKPYSGENRIKIFDTDPLIV